MEWQATIKAAPKGGGEETKQMKHMLIGETDGKGNLVAISYDGNEVVDLRGKTPKEGAEVLRQWIEKNETGLQKDFSENH